MAKRGAGPSDRSADPQKRPRRRRLAVRRPLGWPRYMVERRISDGSITYYWRVRAKDRAAGFPIDSEVLGSDYATAVDRANMLNAHYDAWRQGRHAAKDMDLSPRFGSITWLFERYRRSPPAPARAAKAMSRRELMSLKGTERLLPFRLAKLEGVVRYRGRTPPLIPFPPAIVIPRPGNCPACQVARNIDAPRRPSASLVWESPYHR
jgi:hypothetical protein